MGFIIHFYIIFGTNLLTGGLVQIAVFCLFQCFAEKEYQTESKRKETFGRIVFGTTQSRRLGVEVKEATRRPRGRRARPPPSWAPRSSTDVLLLPIYILLYPRNIRESHETSFPPPQPSVPVRSHLRAFSDDLPEGDSIMEGFYINTIASSMMCE